MTNLLGELKNFSIPALSDAHLRRLSSAGRFPRSICC
jgi:hypothetical protein